MIGHASVWCQVVIVATYVYGGARLWWKCLAINCQACSIAMSALLPQYKIKNNQYIFEFNMSKLSY